MLEGSRQLEAEGFNAKLGIVTAPIAFIAASVAIGLATAVTSSRSKPNKRRLHLVVTLWAIGGLGGECSFRTPKILPSGRSLHR
jgi:hypothetical protein